MITPAHHAVKPMTTVIVRPGRDLLVGNQALRFPCGPALLEPCLGICESLQIALVWRTEKAHLARLDLALVWPAGVALRFAMPVQLRLQADSNHAIEPISPPAIRGFSARLGFDFLARDGLSTVHTLACTSVDGRLIWVLPMWSAPTNHAVRLKRHCTTTRPSHPEQSAPPIVPLLPWRASRYSEAVPPHRSADR